MGERLRVAVDGRRTVVDRIGRPSAIAMQVVLWTTVVGSALAARNFVWPMDPISVVGAADGPVALAFSGGLVATGLFALPFAAWLATSGRPVQGACYGLVGLSFAFGGLFPVPSDLHALASGIFVFTWLVCWSDAAGAWREGDGRRAAVVFALGALAVGVWLPYDLGVESAQMGYAAAEAVTFAVITVWTLWTIRSK